MLNVVFTGFALGRAKIPHVEQRSVTGTKIATVGELAFSGQGFRSFGQGFASTAILGSYRMLRPCAARKPA